MGQLASTVPHDFNEFGIKNAVVSNLSGPSQFGQQTISRSQLQFPQPPHPTASAVANDLLSRQQNLQNTQFMQTQNFSQANAPSFNQTQSNFAFASQQQSAVNDPALQQSLLQNAKRSNVNADPHPQNSYIPYSQMSFSGEPIGAAGHAPA